MTSSFLRFLDHTQRRTKVGRTSLDKWSARHIDLYLKTHRNHNKHPCPRLVRTHSLNRRAATELCLRPGVYWDRPSTTPAPWYRSSGRRSRVFSVQLSSNAFCRRSVEL